LPSLGAASSSVLGCWIIGFVSFCAKPRGNLFSVPPLSFTPQTLPREGVDTTYSSDVYQRRIDSSLLLIPRFVAAVGSCCVAPARAVVASGFEIFFFFSTINCWTYFSRILSPICRQLSLVRDRLLLISFPRFVPFMLAVVSCVDFSPISGRVARWFCWRRISRSRCFIRSLPSTAALFLASLSQSTHLACCPLAAPTSPVV